MANFYYHINILERGKFNADVRNLNDETVFEVDASTIEDGFMNHPTDMRNLKDYLIEMKVIDEYDKLINMG